MLTGTAQTPTLAPSQPGPEGTPTPTQRSFSTLEELIGIEGAPNQAETTADNSPSSEPSEK